MKTFTYSLRCPFSSEVMHVGTFSSESPLWLPPSVRDWLGELKLLGHKPIFELLSGSVGEAITLDTIAWFIRDQRKKVGLSIKELAEKAGIDVDVLIRIEEGSEEVSLAELLTVLRMFGASLKIVKKNS